MKKINVKHLAWSMALVASLSVLGGETEWTISKGVAKYVRIEGDRLIVDVPPGVSNVCAYAMRQIDLSDWVHCRLEAEVKCRGTRVVRDPRPARGVKLSLHYTDSQDGDRRYPAASAPEEGDFGWTNLQLAVSFGEVPVAASPKPQLVLGLQQTSGRLEFDLSSLKLREAAPIWPRVNGELKAKYSERVSSLPRLRGVMLPGGDVKRDDFETLSKWGATLARYQMIRGWGKENDNQDVGEYVKWLDGRLDHLKRVVLPLARDGRRIYLEIKPGPEIVPYVKEILDAQTAATPDNLLFITFNRATCRALKESMPQFKAYLLMSSRHWEQGPWGDQAAPPVTEEEVLAALDESRADGLDFHFDRSIATAEMMAKVHATGRTFHVWTVDNLPDALEAFRRGADTVTTNCAQRLLTEYRSQPA